MKNFTRSKRREKKTNIFNFFFFLPQFKICAIFTFNDFHQNESNEGKSTLHNQTYKSNVIQKKVLTFF